MCHGPHRHAPPFTPATYPLRRFVSRRPRDVFRTHAFRCKKQNRPPGLTSTHQLQLRLENNYIFGHKKTQTRHDQVLDQGAGTAPDSRTEIRPRALTNPATGMWNHPVARNPAPERVPLSGPEQGPLAELKNSKS